MHSDMPGSATVIGYSYLNGALKFIVLHNHDMYMCPNTFLGNGYTTLITTHFCDRNYLIYQQ